MGRMLLLIVASLAVVTVITTFAQKRTATRESTARSGSQSTTLAGEAAQSGFDVAVQAVIEDLDARPAVSGVELTSGGGHGQYSYATQSTAYGSVRVGARGAHRGREYVIEGEVLELLPVGAPVVVHGEKAKIEVKNDARVDGADHRVPGAGGGTLLAGPAGSRPAVGFTNEAVRTEAAAEWSSGTLAGLTGASPSGKVTSYAMLSQIFDAALASPSAIQMPTYVLENATVGSPMTPAIIVAEKAELREGARGYGILVVNGDIKIEKDASWEGLILVQALSHEKRKVEVRDQAQILGALALVGREFETESPGGDGFPGGHMDVDIFEGAGIPLDRSYHQHEWDDKYNLTYIDFLTAPDIAPSFADFQAANAGKTLTVEFVNAFNSAGTYAIADATASASGRTEDGFSGTVDVSSITQFRVAFDALCALRGTSPGNVKGDGVYRDRSFTVRFYDAGTLVYSVSAYEHAKGGPRDGDPSCGSGTGPGSGTVDLGTPELYGTLELKVEGEAAILYSEEAAGSVGRALSSARVFTRAFPVIEKSVPVTW